MQSVELLRAERGARKVSCTKLLQSRCGLGLAEAKNATDSLLEGNCPVVHLASDGEARTLITELGSIGIRARFAELQGYNPAVELARAVQPLEKVLPFEVYQTITSLAAHGEWELALSHCLANLPSPLGATPLGVRERLSELAVEFGSPPTTRTTASDA